MLGLYHLVAQTRTVGDEYFQFLLFLFHILVQQLVVRVQTGFTLGLTCLGGHAYPLQLTFQRLPAFAGRLLLHLHPFRLLFQPAGVVSFPGDAFAAVQFQNPSGHMVQEVAVVCHGNHRTLVLLQVLLQPVDTLGIEVVGGLVQKQDVRLLQQQPAQCHTSAFTSREMFHALVFRRTAQGIHGPFQFAVQIPGIGSVNDVLQFGLSDEEFLHLVRILVIFGQTEFLVNLLVLSQRVHNGLHALHDHLFHRLGRIQIRLLSQISYRIPRREHHFTLIGLVQSGDNLEQR